MDTWQFIIDQYKAGNDVAILYVVESIGSSPGRRGFKMAVSSGGLLSGTIGGGIMEHKFVEMARSFIKEPASHTGIYKQVHDTDSKNRSGMICSGEQTIFLYKVQQKDIPFIESLINSLQSRNTGTIKLSMDGIVFSDQKPKKDHFTLENDNNDFLYEETTGNKNILYIIGGGHCSLALSRLIHFMTFYTIVIDDRPGLNTMEYNTFVDEKIIIPTFESCGQIVKEGDNVYVVVMTFGYRTDDLVIRSLTGMKFKYIGLLGSTSKIKKMFDQYKSENFDQDWLAKIHSPVGVNIKSETTEEIAISIAAEIISIKNAI